MQNILLRYRTADCIAEAAFPAFSETARKTADARFPAHIPRQKETAFEPFPQIVWPHIWKRLKSWRLIFWKNHRSVFQLYESAVFLQIQE